jgi:predicted transposase YbfD/YdcC
MAKLIEIFSKVPDFRLNRKKVHSLVEIIFMSICGVICGCQDYVAIHLWAKDNEEWLRKYISLSNGVPSDDTFRRVFRYLDYEAFNRCFIEFTSHLGNLTEGEVIAFDGKCLRGSKDKSKGTNGIYVLGAWASKNKLLLGQLKVGEKTNEIVEMPKLLDILAIKGCLVTADALNCQKEIAKKIVEKEADYLLAVKGNQGELYRQIEQSFVLEKAVSSQETIEKNHGRIEKRTCEVIDNLKWIEVKDEWKNLTTIVKITSQRTILSENKQTFDTRYFICSADLTADKILEASRSHWGIENTLHWTLDVTFQEDSKRNRMDNSAVNFAFLRRITLNLLKKEESKISIEHKRLKANRDSTFLEKVIFREVF